MSSSNVTMSMLENAGTEELIGMFESCLTTGSRRIPAERLAEAWGVLFTRLYLSAEDLVEEMSGSGHGLLEEKRLMLREFIRADCKAGGAFVLEVIQRGGNIDRAALIMLADLSHIGRINWQGSTPLHILAEACDKGIRPTLIRNAGVTVLSATYDRWGVPLLITILSLGDLRKNDLLAVRDMYSKDELKKVRKRNRTGRSAYEIYIEASGRLSRNAPLERNKFTSSHAMKEMKMGKGSRKQISSQGRQADVFGDSGEENTGAGTSQRYSELTQKPLDNIDLFRRQMKEKR